MKKYTLLLLFFITSFYVKSTHIYGGDIQVEQVSDNHFKVSLKMFRECYGMAAPDSLQYLRVYDKGTGRIISRIVVEKDSFDNVVFGCDSASYLPCVETHYYSTIIELPNNPSGYYMTYSHCCGVSYTVNASSNSSGRTWSIIIPDPALLGKNNSPKFGKFPIQAFINIASPNKQIDLSCTDVDGDSLVYSLIPLTTGDTNMPISSGTYGPGYYFNNIFGLSGVSSLNSSTGILTARSQVLGNFIVVIKCEEYRNGIKIGEVIRECIITSVNCFKVNSIEVNDLKAIKVYPNPSSGIYSITRVPKEEVQYEVYNSIGKIVGTGNLASVNNQFSLNDNPSGIYLIKFYNDKYLSFTKIIKQ